MRLYHSLEMSNCCHGLITYWQPMWHPCTPVTHTELNADVARKLKSSLLADPPPLLTTQIYIHTHSTLTVCDCFSGHTFMRALKCYQTSLTQCICISISPGQTPINRNTQGHTNNSSPLFKQNSCASPTNRGWENTLSMIQFPSLGGELEFF